ncbi:MAG: serine/threonine transporter SstT, partial [Veillonella sp.]|nr:serine/threonine transporter SstT [Veillonella sp.]
MNRFVKSINRVSLIQQIIIGLIIGILTALYVPDVANELALLGVLFVGALKGIAPILVFFLVIAAISKHRSGQKTGMGSVITLYLLGTFLSAALAVVVSFMFPTTLHLAASAADAAPPQGIVEVMKTLLKNIVDNPVKALMTANYIGILGWALIIGGALRHAPMNTKEVMESIAQAITTVVGWIIRFAPLGIMGLVADSIATNGIEALIGYFQLLVLLLGSMIFVALVVNPLLSFVYLRRNPYPLVFKCLRESAIYAFFT